MRRFATHNAGFTLTEVLVSSAVLGLLVTGMMGLVLRADSAHKTMVAELYATHEANGIIQHITRDVRLASRASLTPGQATAITYSLPSELPGTWGPPLTIGRDVGDANGDGLTDSQVVRIGAGDPEVLGNHVAAGAGAVRGLFFDVTQTGVFVEVTVVRAPARPVTRQTFIAPRNP